MKRFCLILSVIFCLCCLILSAICLAICSPRIIELKQECNLGFDYLGVIVGVLCLLVTVLVGWNIFSAISMNEKILKLRQQTIILQEDTLARAFVSIMNQTSYILEGRKNNDDCYNAISNALFACKHFYLARRYKEENDLMNKLCSFEFANCRLNRTDITNLHQIIGQLREQKLDTSKFEKWIHDYFKYKFDE